MTKKLIAAIALLLVSVLLLSGCSLDGIMSTLSIDVDSYDPALEMAADVLGKTAVQTDLKNGDYTYSLLDDGTAVITAYSGTDSVLVIPDEIDGHTVAALENKALYEGAMTQLVLPDSLKVVGNYAVMYCEKLEKVTFGSGIENIGVSAFESRGNDSEGEGSGSLKELVFNGAPEVIREKAFYYSDKLEEIVLPEGVRTIENWAFAKCLKADRIILGEGLEYIGDHAFLKCRAAKEVVIPSTCKTVDVSAFYQCTAIESLTLKEGVEELKKGAFEECSSIKSVTVPDSVKTMEPYIFYNCAALAECVIGSPEVMEKDIFTGTAEGIKIVTPADSTASDYAAENKLTAVAK